MFALLLLVAPAVSQDDSTFAELIIRGPPDLLGELNGDQIWGRPALFGMPEYNGEFEGILELPESNLKGCDEFDDDTFHDSGHEVIAVIDRGDCHFVRKVYNAQVAGAKGVVVVNHYDGTFLPFMADDGLGASVDIPSIIITKQQGELLKSYIHSTLVEGEIAWGLTLADGEVSWQLFTSAFPENTETQFVKDFVPAIHALENKQRFQPRYRTQTFTYATDDECTNNGRYCFSSQDLGGHILKGADIVKETLRQLCVYQHGNVTSDSLIWWEYRALFDQECEHNPECYEGFTSARILSELALTSPSTRKDLPTDVESCIHASGGFYEGENTLLEAEQTVFEEYGVSWVPRLTINGDFYHGSLLCPEPLNVETCSVLNAMCATFMEGSKPDVCSEQPWEETAEGSETRFLRHSISILGILMILFVLCGVGGFWWFNHRLETTEDSIIGIANIYQPLEETEVADLPRGPPHNALNVQESL